MSGSNKQRIIETNFHVRYAETDAMGVVHHANYLIYFEEGRSHFMREIGSDYANIEASGFQLPVTEARIRYVSSLRYGQLLRVRTWVEENKSRRLTFAYEVLNDEAQVLVSGFTRHIWTDNRGNVTRIPEQWKDFFDSNSI